MTEKCYCKSKKGRKMRYYDGNPRTHLRMKHPFKYGQYGFYCESCGKKGLIKGTATR